MNQDAQFRSRDGSAYLDGWGLRLGFLLVALGARPWCTKKISEERSEAVSRDGYDLLRPSFFSLHLDHVRTLKSWPRQPLRGRRLSTAAI